MIRGEQLYDLNRPCPYRLHVDEELLSITKQKLLLSRYPEEYSDVDNCDWSHGAKVYEVKRLAGYWKDGYDWRAEEAKINEDFQQYKVRIDIPSYGQQVLHFAHHRSSQSAIPLLMVHGWPSSFIEGQKVISPLTHPTSSDAQAFHVVIPSIPGFGPGDAPSKSGFGPITMAKALKVLMVEVLGYDKFVTQGGDWGGYITRSLAMQYPEHVKACHVNFMPCGPPAVYKAPLTMARLILSSWLYTPREKQGLQNMMDYMREGDGYLKQQSTRPQSLGFGLGDSPIGLLAWFLDKFHAWMDVANYKMSDNEVLTFIMMHWIQAATPGLSFYKAASLETGPSNMQNAFTTYLATPWGMSSFPKEVAIPPMDWMRAVANIQFYQEHDTGGHFPAVECPEALVGDLRKWFGGDLVKAAMEA